MPSYFVELSGEGKLIALYVGDSAPPSSGGGMVREITKADYEALYQKFLRNPLSYANGEYLAEQNCVDC